MLSIHRRLQSGNAEAEVEVLVAGVAAAAAVSW